MAYYFFCIELFSHIFYIYPITFSVDPDSKTFDITLIIVLLKHLTDIERPINGIDSLPSETETTPCADLARIKYYRNHIAHVDGKIKRSWLLQAWDDISGVSIKMFTK